MEVKPGYKQTEVGVIPEQWECARMASVARLESGHTPSKREPSYWDGRIPWVSLHDTDGLDGREILTTAQMITEEGLNHSSARMLPKGTVVFSRTATVGKSTVLGRAMATSQDFANYICGPRLHNHFLVYLFRSMGRTWQSLMAGSIHNTIYMPVFEALQIALPPLAEQRAIARALGDVDALLGALDRLIAKKRDLKQAAMQQLLTGQTRLPGFLGEWEVKRIGEFTDCTAGGTPSTLVSSYWGGSIPWMSSGELNLKIVAEVEGRITEDGLNNSSTHMIPRKCVLIGLAGQGKTRGTVAMNMIELCTNQSIAAILPSRAFVPEYLYYNLDTRYDELRGLSTGDGGRGGLNLTIIKSIAVPLPSVAEQTAIAEVLSDLDAELAALEQRRAKTRALKQGMMQELLTGRTRLV